MMKAKKKSIVLAILMSLAMAFTMVPLMGDPACADTGTRDKSINQDDDTVAASISFSTDRNGTIDEWVFKGDLNGNKKITAEDYRLLSDYLNEELSDEEAQLVEENAKNSLFGDLAREDIKLLSHLLKGEITLPSDDGDGKLITFEVSDVPNTGYEIAAVTVNGNLMNLPAKGQSATTEVDGVIYTVAIDADGRGTVSGQSRTENVIAFTHAPIATVLGDEDPEDPPSDDPTEEKFDKTITATDTDGDFAGSTFGHLRARGVAKGKKKVLIRWTDPKLGAAKYILYGNRCNTKGKKYTYVKMKEFNVNTFRYIPTDIHGQKLKKGTYYKFVVAAVDKNGKVVAVSKTVHVTTNGGKKGNDKAVKRVKPTKKAKYTLSAGKIKKLKVKEVKGKKKVARHRPVSWESLNPEIATVSKKGKVTAKGKGTCTIFAYAQNGVYTTFKITVK